MNDIEKHIAKCFREEGFDTAKSLFIKAFLCGVNFAMTMEGKKVKPVPFCAGCMHFPATPTAKFCKMGMKMASKKNVCRYKKN